MLSNGEATGFFTDMCIFFAKTIRLLSLIGCPFAILLSVICFFMAFGINPEFGGSGTNPAIVFERADYLLVSAICLGIGFSGMFLAIALQAFIVFVEHARNQFITASAMQLIKAERETAAPT